MRRVLMTLTATALLAACGGGSTEPGGAAPVSAPAADSVATETDSSTPDSAPAEPDVTAPEATEPNAPVTEAPPETDAPTTTVPADPPLVENGAAITVDAPGAAVGSQPLITWSAVDGAAEYELVVRDGAGEVYWAWSGTETQVRLGGGEIDGGGGPKLPDGAEVSIVAFDADGAFLASSPWTALT